MSGIIILDKNTNREVFNVRKRKFIVGVLILSLMLMGVGYAAWSQTFEVATTVDTGNLTIEATNAHIMGAQLVYDQWGNTKLVYDESIITEAINKGTSIEYNAKNLYPGSSISMLYQVYNGGTIPAVCKNVEISFNRNSNEDLMDEMIVRNVMCTKFDSNGSHFLGSISGVKLIELENALESLIHDVRLEPGESISIGSRDKMSALLLIDFPISAGNETENSQLGFTINTVWEQFNQ